MIEEIKLPEISEGIDTADVTKVLVNVGDSVEVEQPLIELETEKAVFELPSTAAGEVRKILVKEGDTVKVGQTLVAIDTAGGGADKEEKKEPMPAAEDDVKAPKDQKIEPAVDEGKQVEKVVEAAATEQPKPEDKIDDKDTTAFPPAAASPSVRRLARELGVDIHRVSGTGKDDRITAEDVKLYAKGVITSAVVGTAVGPVPASRPLPDFSKFGEIERKPMSKVRRLTADNLSAAWTTVPHVTQHDKADVTDLEAARRRHAKRAEEAGGKLTMTAILLKACAGGLKAFPDFNTSVDMAADEIIYKKYVNIGVAVDTERGLLVPVIRDVDCKSIIELAVGLTKLSENVRNKKVMPDQLEGGNFTISNLGGIGGTYFSPIVYSPEVAILGVSRAEMRPRWNGEKFEPRLMLPLSLSYDHRVIDGALAVRFIRWVAQALEDPVLLALEG
jgi:pyruvate dehydrogenase E2 component (dihydrolipoamide acetyltransferase)